MKNEILEYIRENPKVYDRLRAIRSKIKEGTEIAKLIDEFSHNKNGNVNFIQIGANDGLRNDQIREFIVRDNWNGVFVEPLPSIFEILKRNYGYLENRQFIFLNVAIKSDDLDELNFYVFNQKFLKNLKRSDQLFYLRKSSFYKSHLIKFIENKEHADEHIESIKIRTLSLNEILQKHYNYDRLDFLAIDAEGFEFNILSQLEECSMKPEAILFESRNLGEHKKPLMQLLKNLSYEITEFENDSFALRKDLK